MVSSARTVRVSPPSCACCPAISEPSTGTVELDPKLRMSVLRQDHFAFDDCTVVDTIIQGNRRLYEIMQEKDALYAKDPFTEEDGNRAAELEAEFAELDGWNADTEAARLLQGLGLKADDILYSGMKLPYGRRKGQDSAGTGAVRQAGYHAA